MKTLLMLAGCLMAAGCGSNAAKPDPRVAAIRQQHEQLLAKQKEAGLQVVPLPATEARDSKRAFAELVQESQTNLANLDQLDPAKSQEPAQIALVAQAATQESKLLTMADNTLSLNRDYLARLARLTRSQPQ